MGTIINSESFYATINNKADRLVEFLIFFYFGFGIFLSFFYETWLVGFGVGGLNLILYFGIKTLLPKSSVYQYTGSLVIGIFMAQFIYQMHGLFEMHFTAFIALIILPSYQKIKIFIPVILFIVIHHSIFAYIQYIGFVDGIASYQSIYFTQMDYMDFETFLFHAGLVVLGALIAGSHAIESNKGSKNLFDKIVDSEREQEKATKNIAFANEMANGNYEIDYNLTEDDTLGSALIEMQKNLKESSLKDKRERYMNLGLSNLSDIIRDNDSTVDKLINETLTFIIKYMKLNQGGIFILNDEGDETFLELKGAYAYDRKKYVTNKVALGEGLVGQCFLEKEIIYLKDVPGDYVKITSGLGGATPSTVVIIPIKRDEQIEGVLEVASFKDLEQYEIDFLKAACESITVALGTVKINFRTKMLYEQSQQQTEEMKSQEEEMRQNMEELGATQEDMTRTHADYQKALEKAHSEIEELKKLNLKITGKAAMVV